MYQDTGFINSDIHTNNEQTQNPFLQRLQYVAFAHFKFNVQMVFIIAEIGTNHMGDVKIAKKLIDVAKNAGCDAVKFQKKTVEKIYSKEFLDSSLESPWGTTQRDMRVYREFNLKQFTEIDRYCKFMINFPK